MRGIGQTMIGADTTMTGDTARETLPKGGDMMREAPPTGSNARPYLFYRHALAVRVTHWINVVAIVFLVGTGLNIFNAHGALYWGKDGADADPGGRWLMISAMPAAPGRPAYGFVRIGSLEVRTTGVFGLSGGASGTPQQVAYPAWATFPSYRDLATARTFHFFFAWVLIINGLVYLAHSLATRHLTRDILPRPSELAPANIVHDVVMHARLKFPKGEEAKRYHVLQKLAYAGVTLVLIPLVILTGLGMSPGINAAWPIILDVLGGRQTARSLHWIAANLILVFIVVHVLMVLLAGPYNEIRSMITGKFRIDPETVR